MSQENMPQEMEAYFDNRAFEYEAHMAQKPESAVFRQLVEDQFDDISRQTNILDLGCGTGLEIAHILRKQPNANITCIDLSEGMLNELRKTYSSYLDQLVIVKGSYFDYNLGIEQYDYVVACVTMHHWLYQEKLELYKKVHKSLKNGGLFINNDNIVPEELEEEALKNYQKLLQDGTLRQGTLFHIDIPFSVKTEMQVLEEAGFKKRNLIKEIYSESFNGALIVARK